MAGEMQEKKKITWMKVSQLLFDDLNFRFPGDLRGATQKKLIKILDEDYEPLPIGESLADNGYFVEEPLVVIPSKSEKYIVIEGNRRLAALKFLSDKDMWSLSQDATTWEKLAKRLKTDLSEVPVVKYQTREELITVLGFRHIAGIMTWKPLAKARFINSIVKQGGKEANFDKIAQEIGSKGYAVRKQYAVYRAYLQAVEWQIDTSKLEKDYSVFYRAVSGTSQIAKFVGISNATSPSKLRRPIPSNKQEALTEIIGFIHGTSTVKAVIRDSRELTELGKVIADKSALELLRLKRELKPAYEITGGEKQRLLDNLKAASYSLDEALKDTHRHKKDTEVSEIVRRCAQTLVQIARHFPDVLKELEKKK